MSNTKKYFWLKLKDSFFQQKEIKKLRKIAGGDTYTIIYLKLQLLSIKKEGIIKFDGTEENLAEQLSLEIDEDKDNIIIVLNFLKANNLIEELDEDNYLLTKVPECIGKESESAERVRKHRQLKALEEKTLQLEDSKKNAYSNAKRQKMYRAKKKCLEKQYIPFIEDDYNKEKYNGNYYIVLQRDKYKCAICGSIEDLCVHHIDGCNENVTENNKNVTDSNESVTKNNKSVTDSNESVTENKMLTICKKCQNNIHAGLKIDENLLKSIGYYNYNDDNVTLQSNVTVTKCNIEIDTEIEKDIYTDIYTTQNFVSNSKQVLSSKHKDLIETYTHLQLSNNMIKQIENWNYERLEQAIKIFINQEGKYFALLKKIYNDNGNFVEKHTNDEIDAKSFNNFKAREYDYDSLEQRLLGWDK